LESFLPEHLGCAQKEIQTIMNPWFCSFVICIAGAAGGIVSALMSSNGFALPTRIKGVWCPGAVSTIVAGAFAAFASWAFYGSGAAIDVSKTGELAHLQMSALAGAFLVGVVGAKWITNEAEQALLKKSVQVVGTKEKMSPELAAAMAAGTPLEVLERVTAA
jgi:hypothetical protein